MQLDVNQGNADKVQAQAESEGAVGMDIAVAAARKWATPNGDLAGGVMAVVTSPHHGDEADPGNPESRIIPTVDHGLVWLVSFHVTVPKYTDEMMAQLGKNAPAENPMVDAIVTAVVDAKTGEVYWSHEE
jgi:hypothetical protein